MARLAIGPLRAHPRRVILPDEKCANRSGPPARTCRHDAEALLALSILRGITAALGAIIVALGWRAWMRTRRPTILWFTLGVGVVTFAYLLEGALFQVFGWPLEVVSAIEASLTLVAFSLLVMSLFVSDRRGAHGGLTREMHEVSLAPRT